MVSKADQEQLQYLQQSKEGFSVQWFIFLVDREDQHPWRDNRVIRKVWRTLHYNPEFGHTQAEIQRKPAKKYISIQGGMELRKPSILVVNWVSSCLSFFLSASTAATYIFTAPNYATTVINLGNCALNAEFQHFIVRFIV
jgi:hypothetical protein